MSLIPIIGCAHTVSVNSDSFYGTPVDGFAGSTYVNPGILQSIQKFSEGKILDPKAEGFRKNMHILVSLQN